MLEIGVPDYPYHPWSWYIYLPLVDFMVNVGKYTSPMDGIGLWFGVYIARPRLGSHFMVQEANFSSFRFHHAAGMLPWEERANLSSCKRGEYTHALPETKPASLHLKNGCLEYIRSNRSYLKMDGWNTRFLLGQKAYFQR